MTKGQEIHTGDNDLDALYSYHTYYSDEILHLEVKGRLRGLRDDEIDDLGGLRNADGQVISKINEMIGDDCYLKT